MSGGIFFGRQAKAFNFTGDVDVDGAQRNAHTVVDTVNNSPIANGRFVGVATFTAGQSRRLYHGIPLGPGGIPKGWIVVDSRAGTPVFERTAWDEISITLTSTNACEALFWVFA